MLIMDVKFCGNGCLEVFDVRFGVIFFGRWGLFWRVRYSLGKFVLENVYSEYFIVSEKRVRFLFFVGR